MNKNHLQSLRFVVHALKPEKFETNASLAHVNPIFIFNSNGLHDVILANGPEDCQKLIEDHKNCLRDLGFKV